MKLHTFPRNFTNQQMHLKHTFGQELDYIWRIKILGSLTQMKYEWHLVQQDAIMNYRPVRSIS